MIKVVVCMKQVLDPEAPASTFKIDPEAKRAIPPKGTPPVLNPFDENALEAALKIKDTKGTMITVISMGGRNLATPVVQKALAAGADELILLESDAFDSFDSYSTAYALATAIKKTGEYDFILCGRQASDTNAGQVGSLIAEMLDIPSITIARKIEVDNGKVMVERVTPDGYEVVEASLPALITVTNEFGELRHPTLKDILAGKKKRTTIWGPADIGVEPSQIDAAVQHMKLLKLFQPVRESKCEFISGGSPEDAGANLIIKLRETKLI